MAPRKPDIHVTRDAKGQIVFAIDTPARTPEQDAERKAIMAQCAHVKQRLSRGEPLPSDLLQFVLDKGVDEGIANKLRAGEKLDDYGLHLMLDVWLAHWRLGAN